ncbi:MAG TPA: glycoside hydrolase family 3 C-terminal domain-containing protein [Solirubrobacteraceae bacterium]|nr:glycoside hydrolase family 3 C-terminal domain-containing protein [Solirubrobacteraceae bacterium]
MNVFVRTPHSKRIVNFRSQMFGGGASRTRRLGGLAVLLVGLLVGLAAPAAIAPSASASPSCPWLDQSLPVGQRVQMLMSQMTLANKINMVTGAGFTEPYVFYISAIPSLCIPAMGQEDGPLGVGDGLTGVTQMPSAVSLAATFDPSMADQYGQVVGAEERGKGAMVDLGPTVNIDRDPRWGRSFEAFTEDPFLNGKMAVSDINGVQSQDEMAQVKHLAVYNQETNRNTAADNAIVSQRALHEVYLPAFWAATQQAKASSVMCAYSTINGEYACQNQYLMRTTLDQRWDFPGFVTSDYQAAHSTVQSADAGMDQEMPAPQYYGPALQAAVQDGQVSMGTLDEMVQRILVEMFRFNEFNNPPTGSTTATVTTPANQAVSTAVAEAGTVLLKNVRDTLPLRSTGKSPIAVIGPAASASPTDTGGGSAYVTSTFKVTPLQGIQTAAPAGTPVDYVQGLPTDTSLSPIPSSDISPAYSSTNYGVSYTGTLTAPETGTYVLAFKNPGSYTATYLSLDGKEILANPGTPPTSTYSVAVNLQAGQKYTLTLGGGGPSANLSWATPSDLASGIQQAVNAAKSAATAVVVVSDDTESEAADRASLNLPSAQDELISAVAAVNPHTVVVVDAGAPVAMPWLSQAGAVLDAWYPGESNGTALGAVLFGKVDPGGHLPVTFPQSLSQVPASSPSQFPGVNGQVNYSEGIDVGYRYYNANSETPMFPFGYGLSYTTFNFSNLKITPASVQNSSSGPGATTCGCNGQSSSQATVSATVTNTGKVAGSDVAQLYLGDPGVAGEPPRQLKGFDKVDLQPGQSKTVSFTLNGHDLSYWDDAANGWVVPDGQFHVYVGDSSALGNLPLQGSFNVTRTVGARYVTVSAPDTVDAGSTASVTARLVNGGDYAIPQAQFTLKAPSGWTVSNPGPVDVAAGQTVTQSFNVAAPANASPGTHRLTVTVTPGGGAPVAEGSTTVVVPYSSMSAAYNNTGISDDSDEAAANYDGVGDSFSAQALAAGKPNALTPGGTVTVEGTTFTWPNVKSGTPDNVVTGGQTVDLSGTGTDLGFLGSSQNGTASGIVTIHYTDGSSRSFNLNMADWYANAPAVGNELVTTTSSWNFQSNPLGPHLVSVYFASVPLEQGKTVSSVTLPVLNGAGGKTAMHIFAMAVGNGTPTMGAPYSSLAAAYDNAGISDNSDPSAANFDGTGESYSKQALAVGTPTPLTSGGQATIDGTTFTWPTPVGAPDDVIADGQIIDVSGSGNELGFLGAAGFGAASGTGTITYTDGSTQTYSLSMADWYNNAPVAGDQIATTTSSWNSSGNTQHPVSVYYASVPLESGKTVSSVTLPTISSGVGNGVNAMHIFAIAVGSGTPTSASSSVRSSLIQHGQRGEAHYAGQR